MRTIAVLGLGYVGIPVAVAFGRRFPGTIAFDRDPERVAGLRGGADPTGTLSARELEDAPVHWTSEPEDLAAADLYVLAVPTPIDEHRRPDLGDLHDAARTVGGVLAPGDVVVLESTVYPGVTEEVLGPLLAEVSGLACGVDFHLGYSPERINPGDAEHGFAQVEKIVAAQDPATLELLSTCYGAVVEAGVHAAPTIRVAEAAKVIENVQRDLNIALVNELAMLFDRLDLDTRAVLEAAGTKWNFYPFRPGLVGGHCIGVDPYYLTSKAQAVGCDPQIILAGRRLNDEMGAFIASKTVKLLAERGRAVQGARVAVLGLTYKPDVADLRNTRVPDVVRELEEFGAEVLVHDPLARGDDAERECGLRPVGRDALTALDGIVLAVPHAQLVPLVYELVEGGVDLVIDVLWGLERERLPAGVRYWRP